MANINSQKKRIRQDKKRNLRNKSIKTELKTVLKSLEDSSIENKSNSLINKFYISSCNNLF